MTIAVTPAAIRDYLMTQANAVTFPNEVDPADIRTLPEWLTAGSSREVFNALNDLGVGEQLGLITANGKVDVGTVMLAIAEGDEFGSTLTGEPRENLKWILGTNQFPFDDPDRVAKVESLLPAESFPSCRAHFQALKTRTASINDTIFGGQVTLDDVYAAIAG